MRRIGHSKYPQNVNGRRRQSPSGRWRKQPGELLLKDDLIAFLQAFQDLGLGAVRNTDFDRSLFLTAVRFRVNYLDRSFLVLVIDDGAFGDHEHRFVLFEDDLRVRGHRSFQFATGVIDRDTHFKSGDVVFLRAHGRDLRHLAVEGLVLERFHLDARRLAEIDLADIRLVHLALDVDLARVADGHHQRRRRTEDEDGADSVTAFDVTREHHAIHGRGDGGVVQVLLRVLHAGAGLCDLGLRLLHLGAGHGQLRLRHLLFVGGDLVVLLRVVERRGRDYAGFRHLLRALVGTLEHGNVYALRVRLGAFEVGFRRCLVRGGSL